MMEVRYFGNKESNTVLIQMSEARDLPYIEDEFNSDASYEKYLLMAVVVVDSWNQDLSPWKAPGAFGEDFGDGADKTLEWVLDNVVYLEKDNNSDILESNKDNNIENDSDKGEKSNFKKYYLAGYSLAGLFSLYAAYKTDVFAGVAAVSPSVWFPGFVSFAKERDINCDNVYLSLGDKEHKTRNQEMAKVKDSIEAIYKDLSDKGVNCTLEYNPGNHFKDVNIRMSKAFKWLLEQ